MNDIENSCRFTGRLGKEPEMRYTPKGTAVLDMSIAVDKTVKTDDEYTKETTWVPLTAFGKTAENMNKLLEKGSMVSVDAQYNTGSYEGKDGSKHYTHNFIVRNFKAITYRKNNKDAADDEGASDDFSSLPEGDFPF
jgi:single-strand DNA-binding protein